jgi:hypothetical protein
MYATEQLIEQVSTSAAGLPLTELQAASEALYNAEDALRGLLSNSPVLAETITHMDTAQNALQKALGHTTLARYELQSYIADIGGQTAAVTVLPEKPIRTTTEEREQQLTLLETALGFYGDQDNRHKVLEHARKHFNSCREALRTPLDRERVLNMIEHLLHYTNADGMNADRGTKYMRDVGSYIVINSCPDELVALAEQTDDVILAGRVTDILFAAYARDNHASEAVNDFIRTHIVSYIYQQSEYWKVTDAPASTELYMSAEIIRQSITHTIITIFHRMSAGKIPLASALLNMLQSDDVHFPELVHEIIDTISKDRSATAGLLYGLGMGWEDIVQAWDAGYSEVDKFEKDIGPSGIRLSHLRTILSLEQHKRGTSRLLRERLGIRNFERYSTDLLIATAKLLEAPSSKQASEPPDSYSIYASATYSHNLAFRSRREQLDLVAKVCATHGHYILPVEFSDKDDLQRVHNTINEMGWGEATTLVLNSHGMGDGITPNRTTSYYLHDEPPTIVRFTSQDMQQRGVNSIGSTLAQLVKKTGTIIIASCSVAYDGVNGSFAWHVNQATRRRVEAPSINVECEVAQTPDPVTNKPNIAIRFIEDGTGNIHQPTIFPAPTYNATA